MSPSEAALLGAVNGVRASHGLPPFSVDAALQRAARYHTAKMMRTGAFTHGNFGWRMSRFRVLGRSMAENIAWGNGPYGRPEGIVGTWMRSPPHRANLLRSNYRRIGIGTRVGTFAGARDATVVTADFAGP